MEQAATRTSLMTQELRTKPSVNKLWNKDFSLLVGGQFISIFGNMILSFALPLYLLYISGSAALFGLVMGLTNIPLLLMSPIGGMIADRFRKQRVMFWLDASTTVLIIGYIIASGFTAAIIPIIIVKLMALNAIQGVYMPAVSSSVSVLVNEDRLVSANSAVNLVNSLSGMGGMAIAGALFARFGLFPILIASAVCFGITAIMDLFIRVPFKQQDNSGSIAKIVKGDLSQSIKFMKGKPIILKSIVVTFMLAATLASMIMIGVPVLITQHLGMGMEFVGISQGIMLTGGVLGGIITGVLGSKLKTNKIYIPIMMSGLFLIPIGLAFLLDAPYFVIYVVMTIASVLALATVTMVSIRILSLIQGETSTELIGKVISVVVMLPFLANALGQLAYGMAFERLATLPYVIMFVTAGVVALIAIFTRRSFKSLRI
ncbi:MAG: MFS transporter [Defluviitaleaceae bacterium]|nr:MFS transporter [Defluviitaleaceae bacterium]